jgi:hypothetical protein
MTGLDNDGPERQRGGGRREGLGLQDEAASTKFGTFGPEDY